MLYRSAEVSLIRGNNSCFSHYYFSQQSGPGQLISNWVAVSLGVCIYNGYLSNIDKFESMALRFEDTR